MFLISVRIDLNPTNGPNHASIIMHKYIVATLPTELIFLALHEGIDMLILCFEYTHAPFLQQNRAPVIPLVYLSEQTFFFACENDIPSLVRC